MNRKKVLLAARRGLTLVFAPHDEKALGARALGFECAGA